LAASEGHAPLIEILIKFGGQVDARTNNFRTPLHIACLRGNLSVLQALVQHGADINAKDIDGNTPCHFTSEYGHRYCLKFLLTKQPSLFSNNNEDKSAIDVAINNDILTVSLQCLISFIFVYRNSKNTSPRLIAYQRRTRSQKFQLR
jgi:ankyrin repeat protein